MFQFCLTASVSWLLGSGCQVLYWGSWWHTQEAIRSIVGQLSSQKAAWRTLGWRSHSQECCFFSSIPCLLLYSSLNAAILLWQTWFRCDRCDLEENTGSLCLTWSCVCSLSSAFSRGKTRLPSCLSESVWFSLFFFICSKEK